MYGSPFEWKYVCLPHIHTHILMQTITHSHAHTGDRDTGHKVHTVLATVGAPPDRQQEISYTSVRIIGNGSFGVVYQAKIVETSDFVAIKKVLQDKRFKVRTTEGGARR